ncbi:High affinity immunoglobulin alpha and immunoglobulin mu Fc receptor [Camelus dromedarius]|nr:High affinity immunoglobulin alpha and immunoglobulin mu Fc receptor [Camelus dromedarius]
MDGKAPTKPGEQKVTNQRAGWKTPVLLMLCLLQAANALKGPRLVSGELGGSVTIQCRYAPLLINSHQRKYWCRLSPRPWLCHTVVSTNHYTQRRYRGRVSLTDFPQKGFFVVRLSQLSPEDVGRYRCGIGNSNDMLFFSMNLTVSAGPFSELTHEIKKSSKVALIQMTQSPELSIQPDLLAQVGRKLLQDDPPHLHAA